MTHRKVTQIVMSEPVKTPIGIYLTKSGQEKTRYRFNPNAKPIKSITHKVAIG